jgi:hypothetical protein
MSWLPNLATGKKSSWSFSVRVRGPQQAEVQLDVMMEVYEGSKPYVSGVLAELKRYLPEAQNRWLYRPAERQIQVTRSGRTTDVHLGFELQIGDVVSVFHK